MRTKHDPQTHPPPSLETSALGIAALHVPGFKIEVLGQSGDAVEITINSVYIRGQWFYDPAGLYIEPGTTVHWVPTKWGATVTSFHPSNAKHELRIPG